MLFRSISKRSHEKIADCEQSTEFFTNLPSCTDFLGLNFGPPFSARFQDIKRCFFFQEMCSKEKCRKEFVKLKDLNTTKASYCDLECCFRDDCNDMTSEAIALRFALSGASLTKSIADWLSRSFVYMMVFAVWSSIAQ